EAPPDPAVLEWIGRAGEDIAPSRPDVSTAHGGVDIPADGAVTAADLAPGPAMVRALRLRAPAASAVALAHARLRVTWDDRAEPSIDAPIGLFFGSGSLHDRSGAAFLVRGLLATVRFDAAAVTLSMYYPMPFFRRMRLELVGADAGIAGVG